MKSFSNYNRTHSEKHENRASAVSEDFMTPYTPELKESIEIILENEELHPYFQDELATLAKRHSNVLIGLRGIDDHLRGIQMGRKINPRTDPSTRQAASFFGLDPDRPVSNKPKDHHKSPIPTHFVQTDPDNPRRRIAVSDVVHIDDIHDMRKRALDSLDKIQAKMSLIDPRIRDHTSHAETASHLRDLTRDERGNSHPVHRLPRDMGVRMFGPGVHNPLNRHAEKAGPKSHVELRRLANRGGNQHTEPALHDPEIADALGVKQETIKLHEDKKMNESFGKPPLTPEQMKRAEIYAKRDAKTRELTPDEAEHYKLHSKMYMGGVPNEPKINQNRPTVGDLRKMSKELSADHPLVKRLGREFGRMGDAVSGLDKRDTFSVADAMDDLKDAVKKDREVRRIAQTGAKLAKKAEIQTQGQQALNNSVEYRKQKLEEVKMEEFEALKKQILSHMTEEKDPSKVEGRPQQHSKRAKPKKPKVAKVKTAKPKVVKPKQPKKAKKPKPPTGARAEKQFITRMGGRASTKQAGAQTPDFVIHHKQHGRHVGEMKAGSNIDKMQQRIAVGRSGKFYRTTRQQDNTRLGRFADRAFKRDQTVYQQGTVDVVRPSKTSPTGEKRVKRIAAEPQMLAKGKRDIRLNLKNLHSVMSADESVYVHVHHKTGETVIMPNKKQHHHLGDKMGLSKTVSYHSLARDHGSRQSGFYLRTPRAKGSTANASLSGSSSAMVDHVRHAGGHVFKSLDHAADHLKAHGWGADSGHAS